MTGKELGQQPAFPQHFIYEPEKGQCGQYTSSWEVGYGGMTIRQHIAVEMAKGILANPEMSKQFNALQNIQPEQLQPLAAALAIGYADALLEQLAKDQP